MRLQEIIIEVSEMCDAQAESTVAAALSAVAGVQSVRVDANERRAVVTGDPVVATPEKLRAAIRGAGFATGDVWFAE